MAAGGQGKKLSHLAEPQHFFLPILFIYSFILYSTKCPSKLPQASYDLQPLFTKIPTIFIPSSPLSLESP